MIQGENYRPIRAQNSGSHVSKGPHSVPKRHTRSPGMWIKDQKTRGGPPEQRGGRWGPLGSRPTAMLRRLTQGATALPLLQVASWQLPKVDSRCLGRCNSVERPFLTPSINMRGEVRIRTLLKLQAQVHSSCLALG